MDDRDALIVVLVIVLIILIVCVTIIVSCWYLKRRQRRYNRFRNTGQSEDTPLINSLTRPRIQRAQQQERNALLTCHFYLRTTEEFMFHSQLSQLGSDPEKNWFLITPVPKQNSVSLNIASHILTIQPKSDQLVHISDAESSAQYFRTLNNLFSRLYHPYIEPIVRIDFLHTQQMVVTVKQYQRLGSLKDLLHGVVPTATFHGKYSYRSSGLSLERVRLYSRQILEGLLFLQSKSLLPIKDLHSGNIIMAGSCAQIGSYEYQFLEQRSRIHQFVKRAISSIILPEGMTKAHACEVFCFGGIVFEMLTGYELGEQLRGLTPKHWHDCGRDPEARQMLTRLFDITQPVLTLNEIKEFPYFSKHKTVLKELKDFTPVPGEYSDDVKMLLEEWSASMKKKRNSTMKTTSADTRKTSAILKSNETSIINLSYTPNIPSPTVKSPSSPTLASPPTSNNTKAPVTSSGPPPPPPPPPTPPPPAAQPSPAPASDGSGDRNALLEHIRLGTKLKKTKTNDRSAPKVK